MNTLSALARNRREKIPPVYEDKQIAYLAKQMVDKQQLLIDIVQKSKQLTKRELTGWRRAWQAALSVDNPRWVGLYDTYDDIRVDGHLTGAWDNQRLIETLSKSFKIVDQAGKENPELKQNLESAWFKKYMTYTLEALLYGHSAIQLGRIIEVNGRRGFDRVTLIPRAHVNPTLGVYIREQTDDWKKGISFREDPLRPWVIEATGPNLGLLLKCCPYVIQKRNSEAYWDEFAEIFGMPIRWATTNSREKAEQNKIGLMLENMGSRAWGLFPSGTTMELKETTRGDAFEVYDKRIVRAEKNISKALLGQTMTLDDGASLSQSEVHERVAEKISWSDADFLRDNINDELFPRLIQHGWQLNGYRLDWDEQEELTAEERTERDKVVLENYDVDPSYYTEQGYPILGLKSKNTTNSFF